MQRTGRGEKTPAAVFLDFTQGVSSPHFDCFLNNIKSICPSRRLKCTLTLIRKLTGGWSLNMAANGSIDWDCFRPHGRLLNVRAISEDSLSPGFLKERFYSFCFYLESQNDSFLVSCPNEEPWDKCRNTVSCPSIRKTDRRSVFSIRVVVDIPVKLQALCHSCTSCSFTCCRYSLLHN